MNRLELRDVRIRYGEGRDALTAVDGIDLEVPESGTLGLVGELGCGKSTVARAVVGLIPIVEGQLLLDGVDHTRRRTSKAYRRKVQLVFQDPYSSLNPRMTIGDMLTEAVVIRGVARDARRSETLRTLDLVGFRLRRSSGIRISSRAASGRGSPSRAR